MSLRDLSCGRSVFSVEYGWGLVTSLPPNGNIGVAFKNDNFLASDSPTYVEWYNKNGERLAPIKTQKTLFLYAQEILPISSGQLTI